MNRLTTVLLTTFAMLLLSSGILRSQSAFRLPAVLMITFLNRTQQISYAIGMSDWTKLKSEVEGLGQAAESYAKIIPPGIPMAGQLTAFRENVKGLSAAAERGDAEALGRFFGRIEAGCVSCHKRYRDL